MGFFLAFGVHRALLFVVFGPMGLVSCGCWWLGDGLCSGISFSLSTATVLSTNLLFTATSFFHVVVLNSFGGSLGWYFLCWS